MQHREKVIFLDRLDYFTLAISIFCKLFFKKIYYRDVIKNLRSDLVGKQLIFFNILKLDYLSVSGGLYAKSFDLKYDLENKVLATYFYKNSLYKKIGKYISNQYISDDIVDYSYDDVFLEKLDQIKKINTYLKTLKKSLK